MSGCLCLPFSAREEFADTGEGVGERTACNDEGYGKDNQQQAHAVAEGELLVEDGDTEENRRGGLQRAEDSHGRGADITDGFGGAEQRDSRRQQSERQQVAPQVPSVGRRHGDTLAVAERRDGEHHPAEEQDIEGNFQRGDGLHPAVVHAHEVDGIRERRAHHQQGADGGQCGAVAALVEQADTRQRRGDTEHGEQGDALVEAYPHQERDHERIDEQQRGGDTRVHVVVTEVERERREGKEHAEDGEHRHIAPAYAETMPAQGEHERENRQGEEITKKEHGVSVHARVVKR